MMNQFSVLMSVYIKEKPKFLDECLNSLYLQTVLADEIVIVEDGPLTDKLYSVLSGWEDRLPLKRIVLSENVGLGKALNVGLDKCTNPIIARMDTDDVCLPERFEKQLNEFSKRDLDVCGSWVSEFDKTVEIITSYRKPPSNHDEIVKHSRLKNPMNHPSVMYRKSKVLEVGGYDDVLFFEDYHLWLKLIDKRAKFYNIEEPLVSMRAGLGQLSRRGGLKYALLELDFLKRCRTEKLLSYRHSIRNAVIRFPIRLMPTKGIRKIYKIIRNKEA